MAPINFKAASASARAASQRRKALGGLRTYLGSNVSEGVRGDTNPVRGTPIDRSRAPSLPMPSRTPKALTPGQRSPKVTTPRAPSSPRGGGAIARAGSAASGAGAAASAAIRNQVAKSSSAPSSTSSTPRTSSPRAPAPASPPPSGAKPSGPKSTTGNTQKQDPVSNTLRRKARQANVSPGSFDKGALNRAVSRFTATHAWARQPGQEDAVKQAAAFLLSKESKFYGAKAGEGAKYRRKGGQ